MNSQNNQSIADLVGAAFGQLSHLMKSEFDLARAELSEKLAVIGRAGVMIGAGAILLIPAFVLILFSIAAALIRAGLPDPLAYLLTGIMSLAAAGVLISVGIGRLSPKTLKPGVTMDQILQDKAAIKEMAQ